MTLLLLILLIVCVWGIKFSSFQAGYMSREKTNAVKGIFVCLIFFSHLRGYLLFSDEDYTKLDAAFDMVMRFLGQLIVVVYFFYSGYGIAEQYKKKGKTVICLCLLFVVFLGWRVLFGVDDYGICSLLFIGCLLLFTSVVSVDNKVLQWLGTHCFSIYILQRLPMIVLAHLGFHQKWPFIMSAMILTGILAWAFDLVIGRLDTLIFTSRKRFDL